ncbi:PQQ-binding-like beta-propeller repeat protein [Formosa haliotis]|uniref:PQQ-binding-like beta-propeller repeat protein n=1 Tax=Formosa haliotis TaxID=1555194 RepID=UPI0008268D84|nr:PQQ-binding-like beta-propeller repeat protein [Formosa haliotis]
MKYITLVILLIVCLSCSSDDDNSTATPNSEPESIRIDDIILDGPTITIDWSDAIDKDGDQIFYKLYINSILISETTESISSTTLAYNENYSGRIIGTDKKGGTTEVSFEFSSSDSKLLLYLDGFNTLHALDLYTSTPMWNAKTSFIESHMISDSLIYSGLGGVNGLDILSGEIKWTSTPNTNSNGDYRNIILDETHIYAFGSNSSLYCIDKVTGGKLWQRSFLDNYAPLAIDSDRIFVSSRNDDHLYAINKVTGVADWSYELSNSTGAAPKIETNPLIVNNDIFFGDNIGRFYSFNKNTGTKNWSVDAGRFNSFYSSPTQFNESVITGTYSTLYAYNLNSGAIIWQYVPTGGTIKTSPFIYNDKVYIGISKNGSGELLCLNASNGSVIWSYALENNTTSSPIVFEDIVYIGDWNKNMYAVNAETGQLNWKIKTEEVIFKSPTIVVGAGKNIIYPSVSGLKN